MADSNGNGNGHEPEQGTAPEGAQVELPSILIVFAGEGSAEFQFKTNHITPAQIYALRGWLDSYADSVFHQVQAANDRAAQQQPRIAVPSIVARPGRA